MRRASLPLALAAASVALVALPSGVSGQAADSASVAWSGYVQIFGHAPIDGDGRVELYTLAIGIDAETTGIAGQRFGFHGLARIRDTELREYYDTTVWAQEVYGWWDAPLGRLKAGKVYALGGRFWDGSFFGNVQYFDGLKLDPDFGLSWEGAWSAAEGGETAGEEAWTVGWGAQWLFDSDGLNGALAGRDPETFDGVDEHDQIRLRIAPAWRPAAGVEAGIGGSWARKELEGAGLDDVEVVDTALDAWLDLGWGEAYAEALSRDADARAVDPELEGDYLLLGARARRWGLEPYYNHSRVDYAGGAEEWIHQPGIAWSLSPRFTLLYEFDHWTREEPGGDRSFVDRSHNVVVAIVF